MVCRVFFADEVPQCYSTYSVSFLLCILLNAHNVCMSMYVCMYVCTYSVLGAQLFFSNCPVAKHRVGLLNRDGDRCPYCKMANYSVEYRGPKSMEEKGVEQVVCL